MKKIYILILVILLLALPAVGVAQSYLFSLDRLYVDVFLNDNGTLDIVYQFTFSNAPGAAPIDYVDVGLPNRYFNEYNIQAEVDGSPVAYVSSNEYEGGGTGVAVALGSQAIQPGRSGTVTVYVPGVERMFHPDTQDNAYASMVFSPTWFDSDFVTGSTDVAVTFHMPPDVQPQEPRWHSAPPGWAAEPQTGFDSQGNITYTWRNTRANGYTQYKFGASIPRQYLPADAVKNVSLLERLNINPDDLIGAGICVSIALFFVLVTGASFYADRRRRMNYLPPKISVEGHGIKRGLTAIEAAVLMQQPMDKILTMILFAVVKKGAASVKRRDPLELDITEPQPEGLQAYEIDFLHAFSITRPATRQNELQNTMITLVRSTTNKMKGFSLKETVDYYRDITQRAWDQVEAAETPEVKSAKYDEVMEWTMLDRDYDDRTRRVFTGGPVYVPVWWGRYDPSYPRTAPVSTGSGGGASMPHLPGSDFAASMVNSVQNFSAGVIGSLSDFTGAVTDKTNPVPKTSSSGRSSGGGGCACACACAGCACACAGGGR
ncbi:MAG: hypothetical protein ACWGO1_06385 [Anaerolineales bacterium]